MNTSKPAWASKTLWANGLAMASSMALAGGLDLGLDPAAQAQILVGIMAGVNVILRLVTQDAIR